MSKKAKRSGRDSRRNAARKLSIESLEVRQLMAADAGGAAIAVVAEPNEAVESRFTFTALVGDDAEHEQATVEQVVFLNFDGAENITFDGPVVKEGIDVETFSADGWGADRAVVIDKVMSQLAAESADQNVVFTVDRPEISQAFSTVFLGPDATDFLDDTAIMAVAEQIDRGNQDRSDDAFVDTDAVFDEFAREGFDSLPSVLASVIAHEVGHLRGDAHAEGDDVSAIDAVASHRLPTSPRMTGARAVSGTEVDLDWSSTSNEDGYKVFQWTGRWQEIGRTGRNDTDYRVRGLTPNRTYHFYVRAYNSTGSRFSDYIGVRTQNVALQAPTLQSAVATSSSEVQLRWSNVQNEDGYKVYQWNNGWREIARVGRDSTSHSVRNLNANSTYYFKVAAYKGSVEKSSSSRNVRTLAQQQGLDLTAVSPIADYIGHLGADYMADAGTALLSPVSGRVVHVGPVNGYGTMAVAVEVTLSSYRSLPTEQGGNTWTNRIIIVFGHLRPSSQLIENSNANERFSQGRHELGYSVGSQISVGQRLGYVETHGYEGSSSESHVHVSVMDVANAPSGLSYWRGRLSDSDANRAFYIRPELAWSLLR